MELFYIAASSGVLLTSTFLFNKAAGTLSVKKLNIISLVYYNLIVFSFIGMCCILLGFREHYIIAKIKYDIVVFKSALMVAYVMIMLPLAIICYNHLFIGRNIKQKWYAFIKSDLYFLDTENSVFNILLFFSIFCSLAVLYLFIEIRSFPLLNVIFGGADHRIIRQEVSRGFTGNVYIKNIVVLSFLPIISYIAYIYAYNTTLQKKMVIFFYLYSNLIDYRENV